jgi:hypothetical protein
MVSYQTATATQEFLLEDSDDWEAMKSGVYILVHGYLHLHMKSYRIASVSGRMFVRLNRLCR